MHFTTLLSFWIFGLYTIVSSTPVVRKSLNPNFLKVRSPITDEAFSDWPTNVVMEGGSQTYGLWVPMDGTWYDMGSIQCLGLPAYAIGPCNSVTIDQIGVVAGDGPCSFIGSAGYTVTMPGDAGDGYQTVGPPQEIVSAKCGPN